MHKYELEWPNQVCGNFGNSNTHLKNPNVKDNASLRWILDELT